MFCHSNLPGIGWLSKPKQPKEFSVLTFQSKHQKRGRLPSFLVFRSMMLGTYHDQPPQPPDPELPEELLLEEDEEELLELELPEEEPELLDELALTVTLL